MFYCFFVYVLALASYFTGLHSVSNTKRLFTAKIFFKIYRNLFLFLILVFIFVKK